MSLPKHTGFLGERNAKHLLIRSSYNFTKARIQSFKDKTASDALDDLFNYTFSPDPSKIIDYGTGDAFLTMDPDTYSTTNNQTALKRILISRWLEEAINEPSIQYKMSMFLHNCFTIGFADSGSVRRLYEYTKLLLYFSNKSYKTLAYHMSKDNAMLSYLDGKDNEKDSPNENYAREILELFTIGKGPTDGPGSYTNYTESDISQASRLLTGWKLGGWQEHTNGHASIFGGEFRDNLHDTDDKTFSSKFGNKTITGSTNGEDELTEFIGMIFDQNATAKNICRRLYTFFVADEISPQVETDIISPLATILKDNDYNMEVAVKELLTSQHFYDMADSYAYDNTIGGLVKSPMELYLCSMSYFKVTTPNSVSAYEDHHTVFGSHLYSVYFLGSSMNVFNPPNVAGYPAYYQQPAMSRNWFNSTTYLPRYKFGEMLTTGDLSYGNAKNKDSLIQIDLLSFINDSSNIPNPAEAGAVVTALLDDLFPDSYDNDRYLYFLDNVFLNGLHPKDWELTWDAYINGDNDAFTQAEATSEIPIRMASLIKAIIQSPEYQLF